MEQTLKELAGDLQVIHESLERAEVIERQLGVYWREFAEERDQLRAEVETASGNARLYADKCTALEAEVERLRVDYEQLTQLCKATEERERDAITTAAGLRRALEAGKADRWAATVGNTETNAFAPSPWVLMAETALAASPEDHARQIKAEALRETAVELESLRDHIQYYIAPDDARDDIRRICLNRAKDLREEADRLEAPNGH